MNNINDIGRACSGCQMCSASCPHNAISIKLNSDGFYEPCVDEDLCKNCGLCKKTCGKYNDIIKTTDNLGVYAFKHSNKDILNRVSSGGAAFELAQAALNNGYMIAGTVYDYEHNNAKMKVSCDPNDFVGSKYIQSFVGDIYAKLLCDATKKYIVFGTPCQIYSLDKMTRARNIRDNFILVDFFCHGCPSMLLWKKYISECKEYGRIKKIEFRSKRNAWHEFCLTVNDKPQKNSAHFYDLFFSDTLLSEACYNCSQRSTLKYCDIRVGDFWGDKYDADSEGVSVVIAVSDVGKNLVSSLPADSFIAEHTLEDAVRFQSYDVDWQCNEILRKKLLDELRSESALNDTLKIYYSSISVSRNMKRIIKKIICVMPFSVRAFFRKKFHG